MNEMQCKLPEQAQKLEVEKQSSKRIWFQHEEWMSEWMNKKMNGWMNKQKEEWINEWTKPKWMDEWMNERMKNMNERTRRWMNKWMNNRVR